MAAENCPNASYLVKLETVDYNLIQGTPNFGHSDTNSWGTLILEEKITNDRNKLYLLKQLQYCATALPSKGSFTSKDTTHNWYIL